MERLARRGQGWLWLTALAAASLLAGAPPCHAQEVTTYTYDARGRVTQVARSGGSVSGSVTGYAYDKADNRKTVTVSNSPKGNAADASGGSGAAIGCIVVPLNGFTSVPIN